MASRHARRHRLDSRSQPRVQGAEIDVSSLPTNLIRVPRRQRAPLAAVVRRIALAVSLVFFVALVAWLGGDGYVDSATGEPVGFLDALYYASVTVTTTGYGDITAVSSGTRLATIFLITPARIVFLILVVGTTVEVLTDQSREFLATRRWRRSVRDHILICGFGSTGQSAAAELLKRGIKPSEIVVVDTDISSLDRAAELGFVSIHGNATQRSILEQANVATARSVIVAPNRDDTAVLITLTARELNPTAHIVAGGREQENLHLLRQGGATEVIDATAAVGRMLGLATTAPGAGRFVDDLLDSGNGLDLYEVSPDLSGSEPCAPPHSTLVGIVRDGRRLSPEEIGETEVLSDDRLIVLTEPG